MRNIYTLIPKIIKPFLIILILSLSGFLWANEIIKGPYLSGVTTDQIRITWETTENSNTRVDYADERYYGDYGSFEFQNSISENVIHHTILLTGLNPSTRYNYKVTSGEAESPVHHFRTAVPADQPFHFIAFGDNRSDSVAHQTVVNAVLSYQPDFVLNTGDLVANGGSISDWQTFFNINRELMPITPYFSAIGNHEIPNSLFLDYFEYPNNEQWYSFRYGNSKFIILDNSIPWLLPFSEQPDYLEDELVEAESWADWIFVCFHEPPYSSGNHGSEYTTRLTLCPIMEAHNVFMVFNGHDHCYEHALVNGIHYFVTGGGGAGLYSVGTSDWTVYSERTYHFCHIEVNGTCLRFKAIKPDGTVIDSFNTCPLAVEKGNLPLNSQINAYPNPFNKKVNIEYTSEKNVFSKLAVYNLLGEEICILQQGYLKAGKYLTCWDGNTTGGERSATGIYFLKWDCPGSSKLSRLLYLK
ncbi:metallophosphoesterase family protein [bacterium]|nr:metallophosphoesterase family protein [bacterium]